MNIHQQLSVVNGQFGVLRKRQIVLIQLIGPSHDQLHGSVASEITEQAAHGTRQRRTAPVAALLGGTGPVIAVCRSDPALFSAPDQFLAPGQVARGIPAVSPAVERRHDLRTVNTAPQSDLERIFLIPVERPRAPTELLGREPDQPAMGGNRRQRISEPETVGQENIGRFPPKFRLEELLSQQNVPEKGLCRRHVRVRGIPRTAGQVPAPLGHVFFQPLVTLRVVLLGPGIFDSTLEIEEITGVILQQPEILVQRVQQEFVDRTLYVPAPLGVEMGVRHEIGTVFLCGGLSLRRRRASE